MKLQQPKIAMNLDTGLLDDVFKYDGVIERADITESQLSNVTLDKLMIYSSVIKNCDLSHSHFNRVDFTDVIFENCDLSNVKIDFGSIHRVIFKGCRLTGVQFKKVSIGHVWFEEVKADFIGFIDAKIDSFLTSDSFLGSAVFYNTKLNDI